MNPKLDVFHVNTSDVLWIESAATLESAKARAQELAVRSPGEYFVVDQTTRNKYAIKLDGVERRSAVAERKYESGMQ